MFDFLGISAVNPWLLIGAAAIIGPILIHLLSRRRFRIIEWAAMQFLLDADRHNRKRIRLEHLLLLLLRCLAVVLIALLAARPFLKPSGVLAAVGQHTRTERIVLLDDSPSMSLQTDNRRLFDEARDALARFVRAAAAERSGDLLTLLVTSRPDQPAITGAYLEQLQPITQAIDALEISDSPAHVDRALLAIMQHLDESRRSGSPTLNRVVYMLTDLRRRDWPVTSDQTGDQAGAVTTLLRQLAGQVDAVNVIDLGTGAADNLAVTDIRPQTKTLVAGVPTRFIVTVHNFGLREAANVKVDFTVDQSPPMSFQIDDIPAGADGYAEFGFNFAHPGSFGVTAEISPDALPADNVRRFAARVQTGVEVLLVDGDPSSDHGGGETFFLARAMDPPGDVPSGNRVDIVADQQLGNVTLDQYQVVALCNVYQLPEAQLEALRQWVQRGGGLAVFLGDQVDPILYEEQFADLLPARLVEIRGDPTAQTWAQLAGGAENHPVMAVFAGTANPLLNRVKLTRWWGLQPVADATVVAFLDDADASPLLVERSVGRGRVLVCATAADTAWTAWPADPSYVVAMLEMVNHLCPSRIDTGNLVVGQPIMHDLDISHYSSSGGLTTPNSTAPITLQAVAPATTVPDSPTAPQMQLRHAATDRAGWYVLQLQHHDGSNDELLFAVNLEADEGDLTPASHRELAAALEQTNVRIDDAQTSGLAEGPAAGRVELWRGLVVTLLALLMIEQTLAWTFGRRR